MNKENVLFICTGNSARSQIAESILRKKAEKYFTVYSAGTEPKGINPYTIRVMKEAGYDLSNNKSKHLNEYLGKIKMEIVIAVCSEGDKNCPIFPGVGIKLSWPFEDPAAFEGSEEEKIQKFRIIRDQIEKKIDLWLQERK
jgi:arsenate reductase